MNKERILLILAIVILLVIGSLFLFGGSTTDDSTKIKFNTATFTIPNGYWSDLKVTSGISETINITDGQHVLYIVEYKDGDLNSSIDKHVDRIKNKNGSVNIKTFDVNGVTVYKSEIENDTASIQYWFKDHDKVYSIYTWRGDETIDGTVKTLINSMEFPLFNL